MISFDRLQVDLCFLLVAFLQEHIPARKNYFDEFRGSLGNTAQKYVLNNRDDIGSIDLQGLLSIFISGYPYFLEKDIIRGGTLRTIAHLLYTMRNRMAHQNLNSPISFEENLFDLVTVNRFISLLPCHASSSGQILKLRNDNKNIIEELSYQYNSDGDKLDRSNIDVPAKQITSREDTTIQFEKSNHEIVSLLFKIDPISNHVSEINSKLSRLANLIYSEYGVDLSTDSFSYNDDETPDNSLNEKSGITPLEARELLETLRSKIHSQFPDTKPWCSILREHCLNIILTERVDNIQQFELIVGKPHFLKTDDRHFLFMPEISAIVKKIRDL
jgi:hypothetical protein